MNVRSLLVILATLLLAWLLPNFFYMITSKPSDHKFVYYSSVAQDFCGTVRSNHNGSDERIHKNFKTGQVYTLEEFDDILPLLFYRQLLADDRLPDSIQGKPISVSQLKRERFFWRYSPRQKNKPSIPLYPLFDPAGRVKLELPDDVFRLKEDIEFIVPKDNRIDTLKSRQFKKVFQEEGFKFPATMVAGNPSPRKSYDEGYLVLDSSRALYHFKMQNEQIYFKHIGLPGNVHVRFISPYEPADRNFYAFLFDQNGALYILKTEKYRLEKLPVQPINIDEDKALILANPFYWTVRITTPQKETAYALDAKTLKLVDSCSFYQKQSTNDSLLEYLFPFQWKWRSANTVFLKPVFKFGSPFVFIANICFLAVFIGSVRFGLYKNSPLAMLWIPLTGVFGFTACLLFVERGQMGFVNKLKKLFVEKFKA